MYYFNSAVTAAATYPLFSAERLKQYLLQSLGTSIWYILVIEMNETRGFQGLWYPVAVYQGGHAVSQHSSADAQSCLWELLGAIDLKDRLLISL